MRKQHVKAYAIPLEMLVEGTNKNLQLRLAGVLCRPPEN
jgi:hypothetical protein